MVAFDDSDLGDATVPKQPSLEDLTGLRTWALAIQRWQNDGAQTLAEHGLSWGGFDTLLVLLDGPLRSGEITEQLGFTTGGMAKLLKNLESAGLIARQRGDDDLRVISVELTATGRQRARDAGAALMEMRDFDYREWKISTESQRTLSKAFQRLSRLKREA